jgi:hypothetical protein
MMKKLLASIILVPLLSGTVIAQSIYLRAGTGYGLPTATSSIGENRSQTSVNTVNGTTTSGSVKGVNASYGSGFNMNFGFGYKINENFIFDLNFQYLIGRKYKTSDTYNYTSGTFNENDYNNTTTSSKGFFINPSLIFSAGFGKAVPYGRFGLFAGSPTVTGENSYYNNGDGIVKRDTKWEYTKGLAVGFQGAVGMNWKLTDKIDLFTELNFISMTYYAGEYNLLQSSYNNIDNLAGMSVSQKQTVYKKKFDPTKVNNDFTKPNTAVRQSTPFSSLSFQAGIRIPLWKKAE